MTTRLRKSFNGWLLGLVCGQHFGRVLNLGCGLDLDQEGRTYSSYFDCDEIVKVDDNSVEQGQVGFTAKAECLPFEDNSFDFVFCNWAFYYMDRNRAFSEIKRVLKSGGRLFVTYWFEDETLVYEARKLFDFQWTQTSFATLRCDRTLDNRVGVAEAFYGVLHK